MVPRVEILGTLPGWCRARLGASRAQAGQSHLLVGADALTVAPALERRLAAMPPGTRLRPVAGADGLEWMHAAFLANRSDVLPPEAARAEGLDLDSVYWRPRRTNGPDPATVDDALVLRALSVMRASAFTLGAEQAAAAVGLCGRQLRRRMEAACGIAPGVLTIRRLAAAGAPMASTTVATAAQSGAHWIVGAASLLARRRHRLGRLSRLS